VLLPPAGVPPEPLPPLAAPPVKLAPVALPPVGAPPVALPPDQEPPATTAPPMAVPPVDEPPVGPAMPTPPVVESAPPLGAEPPAVAAPPPRGSAPPMLVAAPALELPPIELPPALPCPPLAPRLPAAGASGWGSSEPEQAKDPPAATSENSKSLPIPRTMFDSRQISPRCVRQPKFMDDEACVLQARSVKTVEKAVDQGYSPCPRARVTLGLLLGSSMHWQRLGRPLVALAFSLSVRGVRADLVAAPPADCPPGTRGATSHAGPHCLPVSCDQATPCPAGATCVTEHLCSVERKFVNMSGHGTATVIQGRCQNGQCAEGTCRPERVCVSHEAAAGGRPSAVDLGSDTGQLALYEGGTSAPPNRIEDRGSGGGSDGGSDQAIAGQGLGRTQDSTTPDVARLSPQPTADQRSGRAESGCHGLAWASAAAGVGLAALAAVAAFLLRRRGRERRAPGQTSRRP
jgi:hypothetical protein